MADEEVQTFQFKATDLLGNEIPTLENHSGNVIIEYSNGDRF